MPCSPSTYPLDGSLGLRFEDWPKSFRGAVPRHEPFITEIWAEVRPNISVKGSPRTAVTRLRFRVDIRRGWETNAQGQREERNPTAMALSQLL